MSILTPEYQVHCLDSSSGKVVWRRGPYDSIALAEEAMKGFEPYVILERAVTKWDPVPNSSDWPCDD
jgi:hypothetical protein